MFTPQKEFHFGLKDLYDFLSLVLQGVHDIFQGSPDRLWGPEEPRINKLVFIGKNLDREEIEKGFKACLL